MIKFLGFLKREVFLEIVKIRSGVINSRHKRILNKHLSKKFSEKKSNSCLFVEIPILKKETKF